MLVYTSVKKLKEELEPGAVVLVPSLLLNTMTRHLDLRLAQVPEEGSVRVRAPLYVYEADPYATLVKELRKEIKGGAKTKIGVKNTASVTLELTWRRSESETKVLDAENLPEAHTNEVVGEIRRLAEDGREAVGENIILLHTPVVSHRLLEKLVSKANDATVAPIYIAVPTPLTHVDRDLVNAVGSLSRKDVAVLLGIEPEPVNIETREGKYVDADILPAYLARKIIEDAYPVPSVYRAERSKDLAYDVLYRLFTEAPRSGRPGDRLSVNTVFLNALRSTVMRRLSELDSAEPNPWNVSFYLYEYSSALAKRESEILSKYAEMLGAPQETVELIRNARWALPASGFAEQRSRRSYSEETEEDMLSVL